MPWTVTLKRPACASTKTEEEKRHITQKPHLCAVLGVGWASFFFFISLFFTTRRYLTQRRSMFAHTVFFLTMAILEL
jgi:hypothetical protein